MQKDNDNIKKTEFGYEIAWAKNESYGGKIIVFDKPGKTNFVFSQNTERSWFVNSGKFVFRWIDTQTGHVYQQEAEDGFVFSAKTLVPCAIECLTPNGSLSEVNNGGKDNDIFVVLTKENY